MWRGDSPFLKSSGQPGLRARGGFEIALEWKAGNLTRATVLSTLGQPCVVRYGDTKKEVSLRAGESADVAF
jgi:alpha-L-fucosidase 2